MAKSRSSRDRSPAPPRSSGMGLTQVALITGFVAILASIIGVFFAGSQKDTTASRVGDSLGAGLVSLVTAADPTAWHKDFGTSSEMKATLKKYYPNVNFGKLTVATKKSRDRRDGELMMRNKDRLGPVYDVIDPNGPFRGVLLRTGNEGVMTDQSVGARFKDHLFQTQRTLAGNINVASMPATVPGGSSFQARIFHKEYTAVNGKRGGDAYVILAESALVSRGGGPGMWLFLTPLLVALAAGMMAMYALKYADGVRSLARDLDTIGRGHLDVRVATTGSGEISFAQRTADRMAKNLQLIQTTGSGDLDEAIEKELDTAGQIHESLRPSDPPRVLGYELETLFKAGRDIGGDYYDYIELDERRVVLLIADCSESLRGVPAAMVMAMTRAYLKAAIDPDTGPADWLKNVNRKLARDLKSGMAVTALAVSINTSTHEVLAASAGHRPIIMWRQGKTAMINPSGIALGLDIGPVFNKTMEEKKFSMEKNDRIVLYTDGVIAAENEAGEAYGDQRFMDSIRRQGAMNSSAFVNFVYAGVDKFLGEDEQNDDITICTLKRMK